MRITVTRRRRLRRLIVGAVAAAVVTVGVPTGVAAAGPAALTLAGLAGASLQPPPEGGPVGSEPPSAGGSSAASRARASEQERARARIAEQQARARAAVIKRAAQLAEAGQRAEASWEARGRPAAMALVRPTSVDLVTEGRLTRRIPRREGDLTLAALDGYLPASWLSITDGAAQLAAAVVLTPRVTLDIGGPVTTLKLAGGATLPEAASIYTGGGRLVLHGVTVTSADRTFQQAIPPSPGRPFLAVSPGGRLEATDATISDLGTAPDDPTNRPGVQFQTDSGGSLVRTSFLRNGTGLRLSGSQDVRLQDLAIRESTGEGLVLNGDRGTTMSGIRAERNGSNGVRVSGAGTGRSITGISTAGNGRFGIAAIKLTSTQITGVATVGDESGGLELAQSRDVTVTDFTATDEPIGVFTHIGSTNLVLDRLAITGGRRGVVVEKTTKHLVVQSSTVTRARVTGVGVGGTEVELREVSVRDSRTGVRIERGAEGVTAIGLRLSGGQDGVVATAGTARVVLHNLRASGIKNDAVRTFSPDAWILGGTITGAATGITVGAATTISGTAITLVNNGIRARSRGPVHADGVSIHAVAVGIDTAAGSPFLLTASRVNALEAVRGQLTQQGVNDLSLPPLNLLGAIGIPLVLLAVLLELVHTTRQRHFGGRARRWTPPALPAPTTSAELTATSASPTPTTGSPRIGPPRAAAQEAIATG
jgi:hypothetical protein